MNASSPESGGEGAPEPVASSGQDETVEVDAEEPATTAPGEVESGAHVEAETYQVVEAEEANIQPTTASFAGADWSAERDNGDDGTGRAEWAALDEAPEKAFAEVDGALLPGPTEVKPPETEIHERPVSSTLVPREDASEGQQFGETPGVENPWAGDRAHGTAIAALGDELSTIRETLTGLLAAVERLEAQLTHLSESAKQPLQR